MPQIITDRYSLCHNVHVSSFRDRFNPEAVHFPSGIRRKVLIVISAAVVLLCLAPTYWIDQPLRPIVIDSILAVLVLAFLISSWPSSLITDQFGVSKKSVYPGKSIFIAWKEVASVEHFRQFGGFLSSLGIDNDALAVNSSGGKRIVHGPEHSDRARFLHELGIYGVSVEASPATRPERE